MNLFYESILPKMQNAIFNWSGGKDSALSLYYILREKEFNVQSLVTTVNVDKDRISMHAVRNSLLEKQAESIGLPLYKVRVSEMPSMEEYNMQMHSMLTVFKAQGVTHSIFGDIFLEDLKEYRDQKLAQVDIQGHYPLWKRNTSELLNEFIALGFRTVIVCVNAKYLDDSFLGRELDQDFLNDLPHGVDPCGENGEFHTFVFEGPIFKNPIQFTLGEKIYRSYEGNAAANHDTGFWYIDLLDK
jgi:uncharacterized protein (TIGR00290 family)